MSGRIPRIHVVVATEAERQDFYALAQRTPLPDALGPHLLREPLDPHLAELSLGEVDAEVTLRASLPPGTQLYSPGQEHPADPQPAGAGAAGSQRTADDAPASTGTFQKWPDEIDDRQAVGIAYSTEIDVISSFLRQRISVLVTCDKLSVEYLGPLIAERAGNLQGVRLELIDEDQDPKLLTVPRNHRQRQLDRLRDLLRDLKDDQFLIVPHLDLLSGGAESQCTRRPAASSSCSTTTRAGLILAFADPSLGVPTVLAERFGARVSISGSPRVVRDPVTGKDLALGEVLVRRAEAELFSGFRADDFHKHVAGLNPVRLREAMRYAFAEHQADADPPTDENLRRTIRQFKAQNSESFQVTDVKLDDIGGYQEVKEEIDDALTIMSGLHKIPPRRPEAAERAHVARIHLLRPARDREDHVRQGDRQPTGCHDHGGVRARGHRQVRWRGRAQDQRAVRRGPQERPVRPGLR